MLEVFLKILPLAIASAASPIILAATVALLSKKNFGCAFSFLAGCVLAAAVLAAVGISFAAEDDKVAESMGFSPSIFDIAIGALFLAFGIKVLVEKPAAKQDVPRAGKSGGKIKWFAIGLIGSITNFDAALLNITAVRAIFNSGIALLPKLSLLAFCDFFLLSPALLPIALCILAPEKSQKLLVPVGNAMNKYGRYVVAAIFIIFGILLIKNGI